MLLTSIQSHSSLFLLIKQNERTNKQKKNVSLSPGYKFLCNVARFYFIIVQLYCRCYCCCCFCRKCFDYELCSMCQCILVYCIFVFYYFLLLEGKIRTMCSHSYKCLHLSPSLKISVFFRIDIELTSFSISFLCITY